jgi:hypothetical protein
MKGHIIGGSNVLISSKAEANTFAFMRQAGAWRVAQSAGGLGDEFAKVLDLLAGGQGEVLLSVDMQPLENSYKLQLMQFGSLWEGGGYYRLLTPVGKLKLTGLWLCDSLLHLLGDIPECIYVRRSTGRPSLY